MKSFFENLDPNQLADLLDTLQAKENQGRGISAVRSLIMYLRRGDIDSAKAVYMNESDKIRNYPQIAKIIKQNLGIKELFDV